MLTFSVYDMYPPFLLAYDAEMVTPITVTARAEPGRSTLNVLNYKYKYFPSRKYLSASTLLFGEMYLSTFRVLSKCTLKYNQEYISITEQFCVP